MTAIQLIQSKVRGDGKVPTPDEVVELMKEFARIKCQELLEIVAEKAKIIDEDGDVYEQPYLFFCNGEEYSNWVDKDSILKAVDLSKFIK